jgi:uncharacterized RDD family membrane protein YckC
MRSPIRIRWRRPGAPGRLITDFLPPEGVPIRFEVATIGARLGAQLIDITLTVAALVGFMFLLGWSGLAGFDGFLAAGALLFFAIRVPYYTAAELMWNGQTIGKRVLGLRVISGDGRSLSAHAVTVRNLMKEMEIFVPGTYLLAGPALGWPMQAALLAWITVLVLVPMRSPRRQRFGDIIANTYVVNLPQAVLLPDLAAGRQYSAERASSRFLPHQLDHYGRYELQTLEALLQVQPGAQDVQARQRHAETALKVAEVIARRIDFAERITSGNARQFLSDFYAAQRAYLENRKLFGDAREDKHHGASRPGRANERH